jgi:hypothetical protein
LSPRPGGEADKLGNRYEGAWAIRHALYCLVRDNCSMTVEALASTASWAQSACTLRAVKPPLCLRRWGMASGRRRPRLNTANPTFHLLRATR